LEFECFSAKCGLGMGDATIGSFTWNQVGVYLLNPSESNS
tara:strand:- start:185 stop:304 length:120 start_codon:yes stop_codon:yes gene_type:complete